MPDTLTHDLLLPLDTRVRFNNGRPTTGKVVGFGLVKQDGETHSVYLIELDRPWFARNQGIVTTVVVAPHNVEDDWCPTHSTYDCPFEGLG